MASEWSVLPWTLPWKGSKPSGYFLWSSGAFFDVSSKFPVTLPNQLHPNAFNCHVLASLQIATVCKLIRLDGSFFFERVKLEVIQELPRNSGNWAWQKETCQWRWCWLRHSTKSSVPSWEWRLMGSNMFAPVESISGQLRILGRRVTIPKLESLRMELSAERLLGCYRMP